MKEELWLDQRSKSSRLVTQLIIWTHIYTQINNIFTLKLRFSENIYRFIYYVRNGLGLSPNKVMWDFYRQNGTGICFIRVLRFPLPIILPNALNPFSCMIWGWYTKPNSGRRARWTQYQTHIISGKYFLLTVYSIKSIKGLKPDEENDFDQFT
jgi:hypothetical protein